MIADTSRIALPKNMATTVCAAGCMSHMRAVGRPTSCLPRYRRWSTQRTSQVGEVLPLKSLPGACRKPRLT
jgi:hypothetical protein